MTRWVSRAAAFTVLLFVLGCSSNQRTCVGAREVGDVIELRDLEVSITEAGRIAAIKWCGEKPGEFLLSDVKDEQDRVAVDALLLRARLATLQGHKSVVRIQGRFRVGPIVRDADNELTLIRLDQANYVRAKVDR